MNSVKLSPNAATVHPVAPFQSDAVFTQNVPNRLSEMIWLFHTICLVIGTETGSSLFRN